MKPRDLETKLAPLLADPERFQSLTQEDSEYYGNPDLVLLDPPKTTDPNAAKKRQNWLGWRAASYPAQRHSEYLFKLHRDCERGGPRILLSAVLDPTAGLEAYLALFNNKQRYHVTGRKATNLGYVAKPINPREHAAEIYNIVHSSETRQGRPIVQQFWDRPVNHNFPDYLEYQDFNYKDICVGVFDPDGVMVAYLLGKRVGDHVQYDEIMGHYDHVGNRIVFLLNFFFIQECLKQEKVPRCLNYGPWYSGVNPYSPKGGLNFWKRRTRFRPVYLITASC